MEASDQDGALLLHFPRQEQWVGVFLKLQSQTWHTDDATGRQLTPDVSGPAADSTGAGNPFVPGGRPTPEAPDGGVRIVAALPNPIIESPEIETVALLISPIVTLADLQAVHPVY